MNSKAWLALATQKLQSAGIGTAGLDALVLLEDCLQTDRAQLLAHPETELTSEQKKKLDSHIKKRAEHVPLAYIRGKTEFYGREFTLNKNVLEPRPESETMMDLLKKIRQKALRIADIGTGSGAIAITVKLEIPDAKVFACDIDPNCLKLAQQNATAHSVDVSFYKSDLLLPHQGPYDVLLCNLPYVPENYQINQAAMMEPRIAIFGGEDGLELYRKLFTQISALRWKPKYILTESLPFQHNDLASIAQKHAYGLQETSDFIQVFRKA